MGENKKIFNEFPPVSTEKWEELIQKDLKGADYEKKLVWKTPDGLKINPYYREENLSGLEYLSVLPGVFPFIRGNKKDNAWEIRQDIIIDSIDEANSKAVNALAKGAHAITFSTKNIEFKKQAEFSLLIKGINLEKTPLHFISGKQSPIILNFLDEEIQKQNTCGEHSRTIDRNKINGSINLDCIGYLTTTGNFFESEEADFVQLKKAIFEAETKFPNFKLIAISGYSLHNAGSSIVQELAFSLAMGNEYLGRLTELGLTADEILPHIHFNFAVGSSYFLEIAKLRAARLLWATLANAYKPHSQEATKAHIHSVTSYWNKTMYDPYVNLLRTTTEAMSSIIGGTDSLSVKPFDIGFKKSDEYSERIARNQQILLKEESFLDKINDPAAGSYYIENITNAIAEEAWKLFLSVESKGGYIVAFKQEFIQKEIHAVAQQRYLNIALRKDILLGTNQYPNTLEEAGKNLTLQCSQKRKEPFGNIIAPPIKHYRGAEAFEELRLKTEKHPGGKPSVFLLTFGNPAMRKARAGFSANLFNCAGFHVINNHGFKTIDEGVKESIKQKANIVVICSSDDEYAEIVPVIYEKLKGKTILVLAGYPKALVDNFRAMGLKHFIYRGCNVLEILQNIQKKLGL
ncbi:MAG: methylmalonyl-CoA mutase small subunit [Bacteroidia bacterium]|nr:methylmalonyl-CoA mutase small subunit [Bacteroidia bacterium]